MDPLVERSSDVAVSETARDLMADFRSPSRGAPVSGEARCRELLERWFGRPFPKVRPDWLVNPKTGHRLELDCFNEELRLAVEYDGIQHSVFVPHFHASEAAFAAQQERDRAKEAACAERGVALVRADWQPSAKVRERLREIQKGLGEPW